MVDGLWTVEFIVPQGNRYGRGIVTLKDGRLLGGDFGYYYTGSYSIIGTRINARARVIKYDPNSVAVFGNIGAYELEFSGEIDDYQLEGVGNIVGVPNTHIRIVGRKKEDW